MPKAAMSARVLQHDGYEPLKSAIDRIWRASEAGYTYSACCAVTYRPSLWTGTPVGQVSDSVESTAVVSMRRLATDHRTGTAPTSR